VIEYEMAGMEKSAQAFEALDRKIKRKVTKKSVNAAVRPTVKELRKLTPKQTGLLRRSLTHKVKPYRQGAITVGVVGQRKTGSTRAFEKAATRARSDPKRGGLSAKGHAVPIHLIERPVKQHVIKARAKGHASKSLRALAAMTGIGRGTLVFHRFGRLIRVKRVNHPGNSGLGFMKKAAAATKTQSLRAFESKWTTEVSASVTGPNLPGGK